MFELLDLANKAILITDPDELKTFLLDACENNQERVNEVTALMDAIRASNDKEPMPPAIDAIKATKPARKDKEHTFLAMEIAEQVTEDIISDIDRPSLINSLCKGDINLKKKVYLYVDELLDEQFDEKDIVLDALIKQANSGGMPNPEVLVGLPVKNNEEYFLHNFHAKGSFGCVYMGRRTDGKMADHQVAVKVVKPAIKRALDYDLIEQEANIMLTLTHKYVVKVFQLGYVEYNSERLDCHIMEFINGLDIVSSFLNNSNCLTRKLKCFAKVLKAIQYAHDNSVIHGDIKPDNTLVRFGSEDPVVLDFSVSPVLKNTSSVTKNQKAEYAKNYRSFYSSPEYLRGEDLTNKSDIYSLGILLNALLVGENPDINGSFSKPIESSINGALDEPYRWCLKDLSLIIDKASALAPADRYESAQAMIDDVINFIEFKPVNARPKSLAYAMYKKSRTNKRWAASVAICAAFLCYSTLTIYTNVQYERDLSLYKTHSALMNKYFKPVIKKDVLNNNFFDESIDNFNRTNNTTIDGQISYLTDLVDMSMDNNAYAESVRLQQIIQSDEIKPHLTSDQDAVLSSKYALALYMSGDVSEASRIAKPIFQKMAENNYDNPLVVGSFLEMFDSSARYVTSRYEDETPYMDILRVIETKTMTKRRWLSNGEVSFLDNRLSLDDFHTSLLYYHIAKEMYYSFYGDYASTSIGYSEKQYIDEIQPLYQKAEIYIDRALKLISKDKSKVNNYAQYLAVSARIHYELRNVNQAVRQSTQAVEYAMDQWGASQIAKRAHVIDFAILRYVDLDMAIAAATTADDMDDKITGRYKHPDQSLQSIFYTVEANLNAGKMDAAQKAILLALSLYDRNENSSIKFNGLDSLRALLVTYIETTSVEPSNFNRMIAFRALDVIKKSKKRFPKQTKDYELALLQLINMYYKNEPVNLFAYANKYKDIPLYAQEQIYLNLAMIALDQKDNETSMHFANLSEKLMTYNDFEKTNSISVMSRYMRLARVYLGFGDKNAAESAINKALIVYDTHKKELVGSYFEAQLNDLKALLYMA
jgi:serine/threonine protein kinase